MGRPTSFTDFFDIKKTHSAPMTPEERQEFIDAVDREMDRVG